VQTSKEKQKGQLWRHQRKNRKHSNRDNRGEIEGTLVETLREKQKGQ
jgi:hypothetical protein